MLNLTDGLSTTLALKVAERTKDKELEALQNNNIHASAEERFQNEAFDVESVDDFVDNYNVFSFVMKAMDLEEKIYAKAMIKKILKEDPDDSNSLVNRLSDPKLKKLVEVMDFKAGGVTNYNTISMQWRGEMVDRYYETQYQNGQSEINENLGIALKFKEKAADVTSWYSILADEDLGEFMRTALNMTDQQVMLDVDKQKENFEEKYDITKLSDPAEVEKLVQRYAVLADLKNPPASSFSNSPIVSLISSSAGYSYDSYDLTSLSQFSAASLYR